jgi:CDP-glucose 4,6-dehydratase
MTFWASRRVLVTGAGGFLGSWLIRALRERGAVVTGLVRRHGTDAGRSAEPSATPHTVITGSVTDAGLLHRLLDEQAIDSVFHLAAEPIVAKALDQPSAVFETNIRGTWTLLEACRACPRVERVVVASSDKAYGTAARLPYTEDMPLAGRNPYDVSKSCADLLAHCYFETWGLPVAVTRAGNFFGGGDRNFDRIIPGTIRDALAGRRPVLRSDGTMVRDYIYVRDVAAGYLAVAERMADPAVRGQAFNLAAEAPLTVLEICRRVLAACGRPDLEPVVTGAARAEIQAQHLSAAKARDRLGWRPAWSLDAALAETITWYRRELAADAVDAA